MDIGQGRLETGGDLNQYTFAPNVSATVAPFRAWRGLQMIVTKGPKQVTIARARVYREARHMSSKATVKYGTIYAQMRLYLSNYH